jgi:hypothetical protein
MPSRRAAVWILTIAVLATSLVCDLIPSPPQLDPTIEPVQQTIDARLTDLARPLPTATFTLTPLPTGTPTITPTPLPPTATPPKPGSISGKLIYPGPAIPPLRIIAIKTTEKFYQYVDNLQNVVNYQITDLPPGKYYVLSYLITPGRTDPTFAGGYTRAVACGLSVKCTDHTLIEVEVKSGETVKNINPMDWYAPIGTFPRNPTLP